MESESSMNIPYSTKVIAIELSLDVRRSQSQLEACQQCHKLYRHSQLVVNWHEYHCRQHHLSVWGTVIYNHYKSIIIVIFCLCFPLSLLSDFNVTPPTSACYFRTHCLCSLLYPQRGGNFAVLMKSRTSNLNTQTQSTGVPSVLHVPPFPRSHYEPANHTFSFSTNPKWIYKPEYLCYFFINSRTHVEDQNSHHPSLHGILNIENPSCRSQSVLWSLGCLLESFGEVWHSQYLDFNPEQISKHHGAVLLHSPGVWNEQVSLRPCTGHLELLHTE